MVGIICTNYITSWVISIPKKDKSTTLWYANQGGLVYLNIVDTISPFKVYANNKDKDIIKQNMDEISFFYSDIVYDTLTPPMLNYHFLFSVR